MLHFVRAAGLGLALAAAALPAAAQEQRTLVLAMVGTPKGFDSDIWVPGQIETSVNVYDTLTRFGTKKGPDGQTQMDITKIEPHMAESWTVSPDGKEYVFKLKQGVRSHYGNELTAEAVAWAFEKSRWQKRTGLFIMNVAKIEKVEAVSKYEVKFTLAERNRIFLSSTTAPFPAIYDATEVKKHATTDDPYGANWLVNNSAGFGAYQLESVQAGQVATYVQNRNYAFEKPFFTRIIWREVPSPASRIALVKSGQVQYAEQIPNQQLVDLRKDKSVKVESVPGIASATVRMNPKFPPFDNQKFRQAVHYAVDYAAIGEAVFFGLGTRSRSVLSEPIPGYVPAFPYETNIEKAKQLLTEAGMPNGADITLEYSNNWWWEEPLALQMQSSLAKAGIRLTPKRIPATEMNARRAVTQHSLPMLTHLSTPFVPDPAYAMFLTLHSKGASNVNANNDPELDRLIDTSIPEADDAKWLALNAAAQKRQAEYATVVETFLPGHHEVFSSCIEGYVWKPHGRLIWKDLTCKR